MKLVLWAVILVGAVLLASFAGLLFAVRPPRVAVTLRPDDYRLKVERVVIPTEDGLRLSGWFIPKPAAGRVAPQTNDVDVDDRGLIYIVDRYAGFDILELTPPR